MHRSQENTIFRIIIALQQTATDQNQPRGRHIQHCLGGSRTPSFLCFLPKESGCIVLQTHQCVAVGGVLPTKETHPNFFCVHKFYWDFIMWAWLIRSLAMWLHLQPPLPSLGVGLVSRWLKALNLKSVIGLSGTASRHPESSQRKLPVNQTCQVPPWTAKTLLLLGKFQGLEPTSQKMGTKASQILYYPGLKGIAGRERAEEQDTVGDDEVFWKQKPESQLDFIIPSWASHLITLGLRAHSLCS